LQWYKHDANANSDAKLKKLRIKYGMEGYGLYWYCLELIAANVDSHNLTFELEHDSEVISHDTGIHYERVQEMMSYMVSLGLFENRDGVITCLKMAKRLDQSMSSSPRFRAMLKQIKSTNHDVVMTGHDGVMTESCKKRREENRTEENREGALANANGSPNRVLQRGVRVCPKWFTVTDDLQRYAESKIPADLVPNEVEKFRNYEFPRPRKDWEATFRNWICKAAERNPKPKAANEDLRWMARFND